MDSLSFDSIKMEKANAISKYRRVERITALFRFVEILAVVIVVSRFSFSFPAQFAFPVKISGEYFRGISAAALISPRSVFLLGNAIVLVLFFKSGRFPAKDGEGTADLYDEYVEKCRKSEEGKDFDDHRVYGLCYDGSKKMSRSSSEKLERAAVVGRERRRELARSMTDVCRSQRKAAAAVKAEAEEMSSEEFRRTVEAFIARQQRLLREED